MNTDPKPTLLISDDDPEIVRSMARTAKRAGLLVVADLSSQVVQLAKQFHPALILLDINQTVGGVELLERLRADTETALIPVILISAMPALLDQLDGNTRMEFALKPLDEDFMNRLAQRAVASSRHTVMPH